MTIRSGATHMLGLTCENAPTLEAKVHFLSRPSSYPHRPDHVSAKETHMSWVFLAGERVFKLKKPVRYSYLDFTTLEARERYCREETRLNRRLAPGVYRGVVPLTCFATGAMALGGEGEIVDWIVEMQRLPADCMLDVRLKEGRVGEEDISHLAQVLADFYRRAERPRSIRICPSGTSHAKRPRTGPCFYALICGRTNPGCRRFSTSLRRLSGGSALGCRSGRNPAALSTVMAICDRSMSV